VFLDSPRLVEFVIEIQIQMMSVQIRDEEHRRHRSRQFAECVIYVLGLKSHAFLEALILNLGG